jgi:hypothetical protein
VTRGGHDVQRAVSRTLRETLNTLQRTAEELHQALNDLVAACGSTRPTNALPPILRAQTAAASLAASLDVLSRFVATSPSTGDELAAEEGEASAAPVPSRAAPKRPPAPASAPKREPSEAAPTTAADASRELEEDLSLVQQPQLQDFPTVDLNPRIDSPAQTAGRGRASDVAGQRAAASFREMASEISAPTGQAAVNPIEELPPAAASFDISALQPEEQDLHRRANRVAKVSMQDIKMLRPDEVRLGREHKDICVRLRDDIEKAHKEYDRRFQSILVHPVDYFYDWMVEILGEGDPAALGEYPYPSPVARR